MPRPDDCAFPINPEHFVHNKDQDVTGLTKREYFAAKAMQGLCVPAIAGHHNSNDDSELRMKATMAVNLADALIKELNR